MFGCLWWLIGFCASLYSSSTEMRNPKVTALRHSHISERIIPVRKWFSNCHWDGPPSWISQGIGWNIWNTKIEPPTGRFLFAARKTSGSFVSCASFSNINQNKKIFYETSDVQAGILRTYSMWKFQQSNVWFGILWKAGLKFLSNPLMHGSGLC